MLNPHLRRATAIGVIAFWLIGTVGPLVDAHGGPAGDLACAAPGWATPHPVTQFENVLPPVDDGHCELCHLQRLVRHAAQLPSFVAHQNPAAVARPIAIDLPASSVIASHLAPRAPPAL